jgi:hypothetical protein
MARRFLSVLSLLIVMLAVAVQPTVAGGPLPPLPSQAVRDYVLAQTNGAEYIPTGVPPIIPQALNNYGGVFADAENMFDLSQAVSYITHDSRLTEVLVPLKNSGSQVLRPDMVPPGAPTKVGKIIGALFQWERGVMIVVAVYKDMNAAAPERLHYYYNNTQYYESNFRIGDFVDINGDNLLEAVDQGALLSANQSCVAVGLKQVCWSPYNYQRVRSDVSRQTINQTASRMRDSYTTVDFIINDAVPDLYGRSTRNACAAQIATTTTYTGLTACTPTATFSASRESIAGQPIAIMQILSPADVRAYRPDGSFAGVIPVGDYLVMDAMPNITTPGQATLLYLANRDRTNHFLVPSTVQQGYGQSTTVDERWAGIRDGLMSWRGVGY